MHMEDDTLREAVNMLLQAQTIYTTWRPIDEIRRLGFVKMLVGVAANYPDWAHVIRYEPVKLILEVLWLATTSPKVREFSADSAQCLQFEKKYFLHTNNLKKNGEVSKFQKNFKKICKASAFKNMNYSQNWFTNLIFGTKNLQKGPANNSTFFPIF